MAITRVNLPITWPTAQANEALTFGAAVESDAMALDPSCINAQITINVDNDGTPASGDVADAYLVQSASAGNYDSSDAVHPLFLGRMDTYTTDPATITVPIPIPQANFKVRVVSGAASNAYTVSANVTEQRAA
jgi:hypothetical protein